MGGVTRIRAAALGAVMLQPSTKLHCELRRLPLDDVWERFVRRDNGLSKTLLARFAALDLEALQRRTIRADSRIVIPGDDEWPTPLDDLGDLTPWALWLRGKPISKQRSVAVVGSRSCSSYGERTAAEFAAAIADAGLPIVSGGAFGIDAAAHRGALTTATETVAVLAGGVDVVYPAEHSALFERIAGQGTLISESPPGARPTRAAFLIRNRVVAALSYGTVVVEARFRSGALSTARHAADMHRLVMGVPGPVTSAESAGVHELLKAEAQLVTSGADVLSLVAPLGTVIGEERPDVAREWDGLDVAERAVYDAFPARRPTTIGELRGELTQHLSSMELISALAGLAQRGLVAEAVDGTWKLTRKLRAVDS